MAEQKEYLNYTGTKEIVDTIKSIESDINKRIDDINTSSFTAEDKAKLESIQADSIAYLSDDIEVVELEDDLILRSSDVENTLHSTLVDRPLSANQGKILNDTKVDKIEGKGLSTNDYTNAEKNKLSSIADGAEVNVQSDWNETDTSSDAYIKNKPSIPNVSDTYSSISSDAMSGKAVATVVSGLATSLQGVKADTAVQSVKIGTTEYKSGTTVTLPAYPPTITESTVSGWGFTKNTGTYSKPSGGIPASDLASGVIPTSLPASDVTNTYSATGTVPVSGTAVASAINEGLTDALITAAIQADKI